MPGPRVQAEDEIGQSTWEATRGGRLGRQTVGHTLIALGAVQVYHTKTVPTMGREFLVDTGKPVSYTHLTLPTILRV